MKGSISRAGKTQNPVLRSSLAPKPNRNACYAGYLLLKDVDLLPVDLLVGFGLVFPD